ncbi:hypothetical protein, partial [Flammeovirga sp. OC4]|uniref:hypothetical protein n=1 Tax=Flammeovirga sp. OC4 TaxID=1382345 RepID=UPI0005C6A3D9
MLDIVRLGCEVLEIDGQIWVTWLFLKTLNIKEKTINQGTLRARKKNNPRSWVNQKDPDDGRRNLVLLKSIPSRYNPPNEQLVWDMLHRKQRKDE